MAGTLGFGGPGIIATPANVSTSLLRSVTTGSYPTTLDAVRDAYYVTTDSSGSFSVTGEYTCNAGQQVYVYALGGDAGSGTANPAAGFLAVLGACPTSGTLSETVPYVTVNEVSTVAAAYAFAGYATDPTHVGDDEDAPGNSTQALAKTGMANAFANAANMVDTASGTQLLVTPSGTGSVTKRINTLANSLAACVNSSGPGSTQCTAIFQSAPQDGNLDNQLATNLPTDIAAAAINIAHFPAASPAAIYAQASGTGPFEPTVTASPSTWVIYILYTSVGINHLVAADGSGDIWVANLDYYTGLPLDKYSPSGVLLFGDGADPLGTNEVFQSLAIDPAGHAWAVKGDNVTPSNNTLIEIAGDGTLVPGQTFTGNGLNQPTSVAIDGSGDLWVANNAFLDSTGAQNQDFASVSEFASNGTALSPSLTGIQHPSISHPRSVAIDTLGDAWVTNPNNLVKIASDRTVLTGPAGLTGGGLNVPYGVAIDGSNNVWVTNYGGASLSKFDVLGNALSGNGGFTGGGLNDPEAVSIDGSGAVWALSSSSPAYTYVSINRFSSAGVSTMGTTGFPYTGDSDGGLAVDASGNVWLGGAYDDTLTLELIGAGVPVVTPLATGVLLHKLGTRP